MTRKKYCGTAAKAGGNGENKPRPKVMGVPCLLETIPAEVASTDVNSRLHELTEVGQTDASLRFA